MSQPSNFDHLFNRFSDALPRSTFGLHRDLEKNLRAAMNAAFNRMDLVTREEFDVQSAVLARTRARLEALEARVAQLEETLLPQRDRTDSAAQQGLSDTGYED